MHRNFSVQVDSNVFDPPRGGNINNMHHTLRYKTRQVINYYPCNGASESASEEDMNDNNEQDNNQERNSSNGQSQREQLSTMDTESHNVNENVVSHLQKLGIDCDLSIKKNHDRFKDMLQDFISLQQQFSLSEKKTTIEYRKPYIQLNFFKVD